MAAAALDLRKWHWPREPTKAIWIQRLLLLVIVLICGFILNKVLVFSVLFISLRKAWAQPPSLPLAVVSDTPGLEQWTGRGKKQGRSHLSLLL
ncbi:uncharacterized protein LOC118532358 isoform X2 [Halichoerus grypus]